MKISLGVAMLLVCPILALAHNDPVPPTDAFYTGSKNFSADSVCSVCHNGGLNTSNGNIKLGLPGIAYAPGATIPISITITDTGGGRRVWGFELAARFNTGKSAGTFASVNSNTSVHGLGFPANGTVVTHNGIVNGTGTSFTFNVNWTAPADGSNGSVYFSVAGNAANGDNDLSGDRIYTTESILAPAASIPPPTVGAGGVVNAASFVVAPNNTVAKGQIISIFGTNFTPAEADAANVPLPTTLGTANTSVSVCGKPVPLFKVFPGQINAQLPFECPDTGTMPLTVTANGQTSTAENVKIALGSPGIFTMDSSGLGQGIIFHSDNVTQVTSAKPAKAGEIVVIYCTGLGQVDTPFPTGSVATAANHTINAVTVTMGGTDAPVVYSGLVVNLVGLYQINAVVPSNLGTANAALIATVASNNVSPKGVTIPVAP